MPSLKGLVHIHVRVGNVAMGNVNFDKGTLKTQMGKQIVYTNNSVSARDKSTIATHRCRAVAGICENNHDCCIFDSRNIARSFGANFLSQWTKICKRD